MCDCSWNESTANRQWKWVEPRQRRARMRRIWSINTRAPSTRYALGERSSAWCGRKKTIQRLVYRYCWVMIVVPLQQNNNKKTEVCARVLVCIAIVRTTFTISASAFDLNWFVPVKLYRKMNGELTLTISSVTRHLHFGIWASVNADRFSIWSKLFRHFAFLSHNLRWSYWCVGSRMFYDASERLLKELDSSKSQIQKICYVCWIFVSSGIWSWIVQSAETSHNQPIAAMQSAQSTSFQLIQIPIYKTVCLRPMRWRNGMCDDPNVLFVKCFPCPQGWTTSRRTECKHSGNIIGYLHMC